MHRGPTIVAGMAIVALAGTARAEESDHDRAVALFSEARKLIEVGDCGAAATKLQESLALEPSIGARFSLAECTRDADPYGAFWNLREAALLAFVKHDDRLDSAEQQSEAIARNKGGLRFDIDAIDLRAPGFDLRIDDRPIDRFHLRASIAMPSGNHHIVATVADGRGYEGDVRVESGAIMFVRVVLVRPATLAAARSESPPAALPNEDGGLSGRRKLALGLGGVGIATLSAATAFGIVALEKRSELDRACNGDRNACTGRSQLVDPVLDSADQNATFSTVLFAVGGALVLGGAVLWFTDSKSTPKNTAVLRW
jgi:hypothetical protein